MFPPGQVPDRVGFLGREQLEPDRMASRERRTLEAIGQLSSGSASALELDGEPFEPVG
jgi:hypothetical protein